MLNKELKEAIREEKSPMVRIFVICAFVIVTVLYSSNLFIQNKSDKAKDERISFLEKENMAKDRKIDSLTVQQYHFVLEMLHKSDKMSEFKNSWDSLNSELVNIKQTLTTK